MTLYWVLFGVMLLFSLRNWSKTVIAWLPLQLLFNECVCLKYTSPAVSFVLAVDFLLLFIYFAQRKRLRLNQRPFFFKEVLIAYLVSYLLSMLFSTVSIGEVLTGTIKYFIQNFIILYLFQKAITGYDEIRLFVKTIFVVAVLIVSLGLFESIVGDNPVLDYVFMNAPIDAVEGKMYYIPPFLSYTGELAERFGMVRVFSFFSIHIAFGCACVILLFFYAYLYKFNNTLINKFYLVIGITLFLIGVFLCNSKTPIAGLLFFAIGILSFKDISRGYVVLFIVISVFVLVTYFPDYLKNIIALFNSKVAEEGGGSNVDMRARQFEVGFNLFEKSPLFGNGIGSIAVFMKGGNNADLLGAESSWLKILPERGIVGVIVYLYLYLTMYRKLLPYMNKKALVCFLAGLLAMETATGFMNMTIYGSMVIALYMTGIFRKTTKCDYYE